MVWCCGPVEVFTPETGVNELKQNDGGLYPGQRRQFAQTSGNALIAAVPVNAGHEGEDLVSVTVPEGVAAGQTIAVMAPDGSRLVKATIPHGLNPGDSFLVRLATPIQSDVLGAQPIQPPGGQPTFADALDNWLTPSPDTAVVASVHHHGYEKSEHTVAEAVATPVHETSTPALVSPQIQQAPTQQVPAVQQQMPVRQVSGQPVNAHVEQAETRQEHDVRNPPLTNSSPPQASIQTSPSNQKLLLVHVPHGMPAGATMQVEVPGENRTLTAQVPPGAQSFHIAYTPRPQQQQPPHQQQTRSSPPTPVQAPSTLVLRPQSPSVGQKLLLVRVPPGTPPGTTLHVSVPDEPGRILAAQVPPGNVQEFHVSYEARPQQQQQHLPSRAGMLAPANHAYVQQQQQQQQQQQYYNNNNAPQQPVNTGYGNYQQAPPPTGHYQQQQQPQQQRMIPNNNYNNRNNGGGGAGNFLLPFLGGAAFGAAGAATYDHFANMNSNNDSNYAAGEETAAAADYGDMDGGGDYGGGDYGGDDFGF